MPAPLAPPRTAERRLERQLRDEYLALIGRLTQELSAINHAQAVSLAQAPQRVRGFGIVKLPAAQKLAEQLHNLRTIR